MKKLSLILLLSIGSQSFLFGNEERASKVATSLTNRIAASCSIAKNAITTGMSNSASFIKDQTHAIATKAGSLTGSVATLFSNGVSCIKGQTNSISNKAVALVTSNPKASIACGVALVAGTAYYLYTRYNKTVSQDNEVGSDFVIID